MAKELKQTVNLVADVRKDIRNEQGPHLGQSENMENRLEKPLISAKLVRQIDAPEYMRRKGIPDKYLVGGTHLQHIRGTLGGSANEFWNAWTMLLGAIYSIGMFDRNLSQFGFPLPFLILLLSVVLHTPFTCGLHCFTGMSRKTRDWWRAADISLIFFCAVPRGIALGWFYFRRRSFICYSLFMAVNLLLCVRTFCGPARLSQRAKTRLVRDLAVIIACYPLPVVLACAEELLRGRPGVGTSTCLGMASCLASAAILYSELLPIPRNHELMHVAVIANHMWEQRFVRNMALASLSQTPS